MEISKFQTVLGLAMQKGMKQFGDLVAFLNIHNLNSNKNEHYDRIIAVLKAAA